METLNCLNNYEKRKKMESTKIPVIKEDDYVVVLVFFARIQRETLPKGRQMMFDFAFSASSHWCRLQV